MKSNPALQATLRLSRASQKVWYAAHLLQAASKSSPAVLVRAAVPAVAAKPAILAQTAKSARAATLAVTGANNTTGYAFGELYLNSPAYPIGTPIPAIPAKPASAAVVGVPAVVAVPAIAAVSLPKIDSVGYSDAVSITRGETVCTVSVKLPYVESVGIVGSNKAIFKEITPSALQATQWVDLPADSALIFNLPGDTATETLEQYFVRNALLCPDCVVNEGSGTDANELPIRYREYTVSVYPSPSFDPLNMDSIQLNEIYDTATNPGS